MGGIGRSHRRWAAALLGSASLAGVAVPALAQEKDGAPVTQQEDGQDANTIIVIGQRSIVASLADVPVEDSYDEDDVASYAADSVGDIIGQIEGERGDQAPALLVNGRPVMDGNDVADLPAEAIRRIEVLPRGAAQRIGGAAGQRAYNVVLKSSVKSATATASREMATEGGWANNRGDLTLTRIEKQDRANLSLRGARSGRLYESERDFAPRTDGTPYAPLGNIIPAAGIEVDPAFSLFAGEPVSVIGVPAGTVSPTFADLLPGANNPASDDLARFRTLRGANRPADLGLSGNKQLSPALSLSLNARLGWLKSTNAIGLPSARFILPATHPDSPFGTSVGLAVNDPTRPLQSSYSTSSRSISATLNGSFGDWRASLNGRWDGRDTRYVSQVGAPLPSAVVGDSQSPFDGSLGRLIPLEERRSRSQGTTRLLAAEAEGPLADLWAGALRARTGLGVTWLGIDADNFSGRRKDHRRELSAKAGLTVPLTGDGFLAAMGDSDFAIDLGVLDVGDQTIHRRELAFNWQPATWLRLTASALRDGRSVALELLSAPLSTFPNTPFFDPLTGETVDVTTLSGGASGLRPERTRRRSLAASLTPLAKYRLQLEAEYRVEETRDPVGFLPPPSSALVAAFPDRFQRDGVGTLVLVDLRPVNFDREYLRSLNLRAGFALPLTAGRPATRGVRRVPPIKLQVNAVHAIILKNTSVLRAGFPEIDLADGGAIGITGGQQRDRSAVSLALTRAGTGLRAQWQRRGTGYLATGTLADPDRLTFRPLSTFDLKAFADLGELAPGLAPARKARVTFAIDNLFNQREQVRDLAGLIPQAYQPVRRDPVGRTVMIELRKVF